MSIQDNPDKTRGRAVQPSTDADRSAPTTPGSFRDAATHNSELSHLETEYSQHNAEHADTISEGNESGGGDTLDGSEQAFGGLLANSERFQDLGRIGMGGMGAVHLVTDAVLLRKVAMKTLHRRLSRKQEHTQRFLREVQITGRLDHPHIVPVHDVGFHESGNAFFVMKHVDGETLTERIIRHRDEPLAGEVLEEFLRIFLKLTDAIGFSHSRGVIHRDLKPSNIMVGSHGEVYVMDWGIARSLEPVKSPTGGQETLEPKEFDGTLLGTVGYMAPEQAEGRVRDVDFRTDVFGLGAILYEMLTGRAPYVASDTSTQLKKAKEAAIRDPMQVARGRQLPPGLCRIAMKAMARDPADRYQSVADLEEAIDSFLRGGGWFETRRVDAGTDIVIEGDEPDAAYIIEAGACEVYKIVDGNRQVLRMLGPGDVFGETSIFTGVKRTASVGAVASTDLVVITRESLDHELGDGWLATFVRALAERFCDLDRKLSQLRAQLGLDDLDETGAMTRAANRPDEKRADTESISRESAQTRAKTD